MYKPSPNRRYRYKPTPEGGLVRHGYHGYAVYVIQPVTQPHRPVFQEEGPSPMDWLQSNYAGQERENGNNALRALRPLYLL